MAASDPTMAVPTPTGALQGVAAFSWDGSAWQPAGRAGPSVATSTGTLQGVAPFSWDGSLWQPTGRSTPDVATPSGVLDGVAVYTWSGSAWVPPSGTEAPSTPSGALRGVASFSWDGSAWQPAAQAGPSVATPFGVLDGVAMFNWSGTAWAAVGAPSLDLSFMTPGTLPSGVTFTRASTGTYFDVAGVMQTATTNSPRWDYDPVTHVLKGMLVEEARTNLLLNSATLGTQSVTTTAVATTLSFYGTGTVTLTGTSTAGPLTGTGPSNRVALTFTPTAGTLTCTVTGSVTNAQVEAGGFATSWIPTTAAAATRAIDVANITPLGAWFNASTGSLAIEFDTVNTASVEGGFSGGAFANVVYLNTTGNGVASNVASVGQSQGGTVIVATGIVQKMAFAYSTGRLAACNNGSTVGTNAALSASPYLWTSNLCIGNAPWAITNNSTTLDGHMRRVRYWPRALSNAELQQVTT